MNRRMRSRGRLGIEATVLLAISGAGLRRQIRWYLENMGLQVVEAIQGARVHEMTPQPWSQIDLFLTDNPEQLESAVAGEVLGDCVELSVVPDGLSPEERPEGARQERELEAKVAALLLARMRARALGCGGFRASCIAVVCESQWPAAAHPLRALESMAGRACVA